MYRQVWDGIEHFGTLDGETEEWPGLDRWTAAQRELKAEIDGERRQERQIADSTGRLVARLVAARWAGEG
jgi:hypothetical protein